MSLRTGPGCLCPSGAGIVSVVIAGRARVGGEDAHLEAIQDAVAAKKLALAGVLGGPGKDFVTGGGHDRRGMSAVGKLRR